VLPRAPNQNFPAYFCLNFIFVLCQERKDSRSTNDVIRHWCKTNRERWLLSLASSPSLPHTLLLCRPHPSFPPPAIGSSNCLITPSASHCWCLDPVQASTHPMSRPLPPNSLLEPSVGTLTPKTSTIKKVVVTCTWPWGPSFFLCKALRTEFVLWFRAN
jgi:hypothetical protein